MTDKELISKLNSLQKISPDQAWLKSNREILLSQISNSGATELSVWKMFIINLESLAKTSLQPAFALGVFALVLISGSLFSHQLFNKTKPNDSLYIARIISERAKLSTVFNSDNREKMAAQFAATHAQDIASTLADPKFDQAANQDQVAHLNASFNKEMETVKSRVNRLASLTTKSPASLITANPDDQVFSAAENNKDNQGIQLSDGRDLGAADKGTLNNVIVNNLIATNSLTATTTLNSSTTTTIKSETAEAVQADKILDEAQELFESKAYDKAVDKLKEVEEIIK